VVGSAAWSMTSTPLDAVQATCVPALGPPILRRAVDRISQIALVDRANGG
jgi:hypothetical protein